MRHVHALLLLTAACGQPLAAPDEASPPPNGLNMSGPSGILWTGRPNTFTVVDTTGSAPGIALQASLLGTAGTLCPPPLGGCSDLSRPAYFLGFRPAPSPATFAIVPPILPSPRTVWFQAMAPSPTGALLSEVFELVALDPVGDEDGDGLLNEEEVAIYGTDWNDDDSDNDGLTDLEEVAIYGTDPLDADTDDDFLIDGVEALGPDLVPGTGDETDPLVPDTLTAAPEGTLAWFDDPLCPAGWSPFVEADGRGLVGVASAVDVGVQVGAAMSSAAPNAHNHAVFTNVSLPSAGVAGLASCCNSEPGQAGTYPVQGPTDAQVGGLPTSLQYVCRKDPPQGSPVGDPFPPGSLAHFDRDTCPAGWISFGPGLGRFLVGRNLGGINLLGVGAALAPGEDRLHTHTITGSVTVPERSLVLAGGGTQYVRRGTWPVVGTSDPAPSGMGWVQALLCEKAGPALAPFGPADEDVPEGATVYGTGAVDCPPGFFEREDTRGRALVGVPPGRSAGETWSDPLDQGEDPTHAHGWFTSVSVPSRQVAGASGCCFFDTGWRGTHPVVGQADPTTTGLPTLAVRFCRKN